MSIFYKAGYKPTTTSQKFKNNKTLQKIIHYILFYIFTT